MGFLKPHSDPEWSQKINAKRKRKKKWKKHFGLQEIEDPLEVIGSEWLKIHPTLKHDKNRDGRVKTSKSLSPLVR